MKASYRKQQNAYNQDIFTVSYLYNNNFCHYHVATENEAMKDVATLNTYTYKNEPQKVDNMEMSKTRQAVNTLKNAIRNNHAWPGGYPVYVILSDGETLCRSCTRKEYKNLLTATRANDRSGWNVVDAEILWEGEYYCAHCSKQLETAYGEIED